MTALHTPVTTDATSAPIGMPAAAVRVPLPAPPAVRARRDFPLLASTAPVAGALVMWAFTQSPFALVFAFLGPVVAVASILDDRRVARRTAATELARFRRGVHTALAGVAAAHAQERETLARMALRPGELLEGAGRDPEWWRAGWGSPILVCLGQGDIASSIAVEPAPGPADADGPAEVADAYQRVCSTARTVTDAPVLVDARHGIGIAGGAVPAGALARSVVAQLAFRLSPADVALSLGGDDWSGWAERMPHPRGVATAHNQVEFRHGGTASRILCAVAPEVAGLPRDCRVIIRLQPDGTAVVERNPSAVRVDRLHPWFLSEPQGLALADLASTWADADSLVNHDGELPQSIAFSRLRPADPVESRLPATFSSGPDGAITVDLVADGPHTVIGGTTGSGKSELLISWVLALATTCSPAEVNFLLVDFKGGSSFASVSGLPHTVGVITDLDGPAAGRALSSLRAELRHRERMIAAAGARCLDELRGSDRLPRLVIVVDEFAVVADEFPELQVLFADLAARGRSLGIHLILCTQRPAGVIRDSVLANCSIRVSLRVNNAADSTAVIGTGAAAGLPPTPHGRCYLSIGGGPPVLAQVALATPADARAVAARWPASQFRVRRPWREPLPETVVPEDVPALSDGLAFGLLDLPEEQSQPPAVYRPDRDGNLLIVGGHNSGKTGALAALEAACRYPGAPCRAVWIPRDVEGAWDAVGAAVSILADQAARSTLYLLDDVDALLARFPDDYRLPFTDRLARLLREGPGRGARAALTAARMSSAVQFLLALCGARLVLRMPSRQEHLLVGAEAEQYSADLPPGAGWWRGHRVQVVSVPAPQLSPARRAEWPLAPEISFAWVAADAQAVAERLRSGGWGDAIEVAAQPPGTLQVSGSTARSILVGTPTDWQALWGVLAAARANGPIVFSGCSVAEFRSLSGSRALPPPIGDRPGGAWILERDGSLARVQLPESVLP